LVNALNAAGTSSSSPLIDADPFTTTVLVSALPVIDYPSADKRACWEKRVTDLDPVSLDISEVQDQEDLY
jgi:hypothetical protein